MSSCHKLKVPVKALDHPKPAARQLLYSSLTVSRRLAGLPAGLKEAFYNESIPVFIQLCAAATTCNFQNLPVPHITQERQAVRPQVRPNLNGAGTHDRRHACIPQSLHMNSACVNLLVHAAMREG